VVSEARGFVENAIVLDHLAPPEVPGSDLD